MLPVEIKPNIYWTGLNDRTTKLFEGLWPINEEGVSYNSYLINDDKKAIIDLSKAMLTEELVGQIMEITDLSQLDYVIINHMEPDHTGALLSLRRIAPQAVFLGSKRACDMLQTFYGISENVRPVADGETLSLGQYTLQFFSTPLVHWPETMMTYEASHKILFSCDAFGSYGALDGCLFDDQTPRLAWFEQEALRYYSNIVAAFSKQVKNAFAKLEGLPVSIVAPSHGLVWRRDPQRILSLYQKWADYGFSTTEPAVTLVYGSMYGNTEKMMEAVIQGIEDTGVPVTVFNVATTHVSYILPSLWVQHGVMVGAPTYEGRLFPSMTNVLQMASLKRIHNKLTARFGSHGWGSGAEKEFTTYAAEMNWEVAGNFEFFGSPTKDELHQGRDYGREFARKVSAIKNSASSS